MAGKNTAVFGIYRDRTSVENAVDVLRQENFRNTDISVLFPENQGTKDFAHEKNTKAPEGAATGAGSGAVIGGTLGWLTGIGALAIPGVGPCIAAGPIVAALAGVGVGGAIGGIAGALIGFCFPCIATTLTGPNGQRKSSNALALRMCRQAAKLMPTSRRLTNPCRAQAKTNQGFMAGIITGCKRKKGGLVMDNEKQQGQQGQGQNRQGGQQDQQRQGGQQDQQRRQPGSDVDDEQENERKRA